MRDACPWTERYLQVRAATLELAAPLSDEDCGAQSMPDASPVKWHLAHTTWFFETFILERFEAGFQPFHPAFRVLFNSYYNGVGDKHPRPQRGLLTRPALAEVRAYRANVDARMAALVARRGNDAALAALLELGLQHEQQHQELILTDVKHLLAQNPLAPAYLPPPAAAQPSPASALDGQRCEGGLCDIGHHGDGFCFDNELPRHKAYVAPFELASRLVTNGEYLAFIAAGGYADPSLWLAEGWDWIRAQGIEAPLYWARNAATASGWDAFTLHGRQALDPAAPARACRRKPNGNTPPARTGCSRCSATAGNGPAAATRHTPASGRRRARLASTTASSWSTNTCCAAPAWPPRPATHAPATATSSPPAPAGSSPASA